METIAPSSCPEVADVRPLRRYRLWVKFTNGEEGVVDLSGIPRTGAFAAWNSKKVFREVYVDYGTAVWDNGKIDISPAALYAEATGTEPEDILPLTVDAPIAVEDRGEECLFLEYKDGTKGMLRVSESLKTGRVFPASERGADGTTELAPWGDILWHGEVELSAAEAKSLLNGALVSQRGNHAEDR